MEYSTEIRWFSKKKNFLQSLYDHCPGKGKDEKVRTDYYLKYQGTDTGIKIREGKHEIKVMHDSSEVISHGLVEHWSKWSTAQMVNILNTIPDAHRKQWLAIKKERLKKKYKWNPTSQQMEYTEGWVTDGCGIEFTKLELCSETWYTFGLEAFGTYRLAKQNLEDTLALINLPRIDLDKYPSYGYPAFMVKNL